MILAQQILHTPILLPDGADVLGGPITAMCTPALVVGVKEVSPDHYVPKPSSLFPNGVAYRTLGNARLALPADAWDVGSTTLTIEFTVEQNAPATGQVGLFGFIRNHKPSPWYCAVVDGQFRFTYRLAGGTVVSPTMNWPGGLVTGKVRRDLAGQKCSLTLNGQTFNFTTPLDKLIARDTPYFGVGAIADRAYGWGDYVGGAHDWTYHNLKVTGGVSSGPSTNESNVPFCRLLGDQPGPVPCYAGFFDAKQNFVTQHAFGFMLDADPKVLETANRNRCRIHDLTIQSSLPCGPLIAVGGIYNLAFEGLVLQGGGQSIASLGGLWSYPVNMLQCELGAPYYGWGQSLYASHTNFQYCGGWFSGSFVTFRDTFVAGSPKGGTMFKLRDGCDSLFDRGQANYEGLPPAAYFDYDADSKPVVRGWVKGKNTPIVVP